MWWFTEPWSSFTLWFLDPVFNDSCFIVMVSFSASRSYDTWIKQRVDKVDKDQETFSPHFLFEKIWHPLTNLKSPCDPFEWRYRLDNKSVVQDSVHNCWIFVEIWLGTVNTGADRPRQPDANMHKGSEVPWVGFWLLKKTLRKKY